MNVKIISSKCTFPHSNLRARFKNQVFVLQVDIYLLKTEIGFKRKENHQPHALTVSLWGT